MHVGSLLVVVFWSYSSTMQASMESNKYMEHHDLFFEAL